MIGALLAATVALAATWSPAERLEPGAPLALSGGVAARLEPGGGTPPTVIDEDGRPVALRALPSGWLVEAAPTSRVLSVDASVRVRRSDAPRSGAWERWETELWRALGRGHAPPEPPWGGAAASIALRAEAVSDRRVAALGALHDVASHRPLVGVAHRSSDVAWGVAEPGAPYTVAVSGPGTAVVSVLPSGVEGVLRHRVALTLDGHPQPSQEMASTGGHPRSIRVWVPPGRHVLAVEVPEARAHVGVAAHRIRPRLFAPGLRASGLSGIDAAELGWLMGDRRAEPFRSLVDAPGPVGALARARVLGATRDLDEAARLVEADPDLLASTALERAADLPDALVRDALARASGPDVELVARWLDTLPGTRPRGLALRSAATPAIPLAPAASLRAPAAATLHTAWMALASDGAPAGHAVSATGPGVERVRVVPGAPVTVDLPDPGLGRAPILRLRAHAPVAYRVDGVYYVAGPGRLDVALAPGPRRVEVERGELLVLDPERAQGGERVREWALSALPATWALPDPGVTVAVRVQLTSAALAVFDSGRSVALGEGTHELIAGPWEGAITLVGEGTGAAAIRANRGALGREAPAPVDDALARLAALTRQVDAGDADARLERARLLAALGQLTWARRDLDALASDPARAAAAGRVPLRAAVPSAARPGPQTVEAALGLRGDDGPAPVGGAALEAAGLWGFASEAWLHDGDAVRATAAAVRADDAEQVARASGRLAFEGITRADQGAGLVEVTVTPALEPAEGLYGRVRDAMHGGPWGPTEAITLRGDLDDQVRFGGRHLEVALYCRDEVGPGDPCRARLQVDGARHERSVADGAAPTTARFELPAGAHVLEVLAPAPGQALSVRVAVDGALLAPVLTRSVLRAAPGRPVALHVAGGSVVRVVSLRGEALATAGGREVRIPEGGAGLLPLPEPGAQRVVVQGDADVALYRGVSRPWSAPEPAPPPEAPVGPDVSEVFDAFVPRAEPWSVPGDRGSLRVGLGGLRDVVAGLHDPWYAVEGSADWFLRDRAGWVRVGGWVHAPIAAAGVRAERGATWDGGFASARGDLAGALGGWRAEGALRVRHDLRLTPDTRLRLASGVNARNPGFLVDGAVDPQVWAPWDRAHPIAWTATPSLVSRPWRDVRLEAGAELAGGINAPAEGVGPVASAHFLAGRTVFGADGALVWGVVRPGWRERIRVMVDHAAWTSPTRQVTTWASVAWSQVGIDASGGVRVLLSPRRGLADLPPDLERFRTAREAP